MSATPYRDLQRATPTEAPPSLSIAWKSGEDPTSFALTNVGILLVFFLAIVSALIAEQWWLVGTLGVLLVAALAFARRASLPRPIALEVHGETLVVQLEQSGPLLEIPLHEVINVEIQRKAIAWVSTEQRIGDGVPVHRVGQEISLGRVVLVRAVPAERVALTTNHAHEYVCMEAFGKVRKFLRAHGWRPLDERDANDADAPHRG